MNRIGILCTSKNTRPKWTGIFTGAPAGIRTPAKPPLRGMLRMRSAPRCSAQKMLRIFQNAFPSWLGLAPFFLRKLEKAGTKREWLSWWSATLPRWRSRVRVPSRALLMQFFKDIQLDVLFVFLFPFPAHIIYTLWNML